MAWQVTQNLARHLVIHGHGLFAIRQRRTVGHLEIDDRFCFYDQKIAISIRSNFRYQCVARQMQHRRAAGGNDVSPCDAAVACVADKRGPSGDGRKSAMRRRDIICHTTNHHGSPCLDTFQVSIGPGERRAQKKRVIGDLGNLMSRICRRESRRHRQESKKWEKKIFGHGLCHLGFVLYVSIRALRCRTKRHERGYAPPVFEGTSEGMGFQPGFVSNEVSMP